MEKTSIEALMENSKVLLKEVATAIDLPQDAEMLTTLAMNLLMMRGIYCDIKEHLPSDKAKDLCTRLTKFFETPIDFENEGAAA